jgi:uncharacterized protein (DUF1501 family)
VTRRTLLKSAALAALPSLATWSRATATIPSRGPLRPRARNVILLWLDGGPSQLETFDPKPGSRFAGSFGAIATAIEGVEFSDRLPRLAAGARRLAVLRSMTTPTADHVRARELALTGRLPSEALTAPLFLCSIAAELDTPDAELPPVVTIGPPLPGAGYLGAAFEPFQVSDPGSAARLLVPSSGMVPERRVARERLLERLDDRFAARTDASRLARFERQWERARRLSEGGAATAFDLQKERPESAATYGGGAIGMSCLLARRLVEHGVRCVGIRSTGWDTHEDNFDQLTTLLADLDPALSALLEELDASGLLDETLVVVSGEFGRTPQINMNSGRDHHWRCFSAVVAGGGVRGGQVIGASDASCEEVARRPVTPPDLLASLYTALGLDPRREFKTPEGRPVKRLETGEPVHELFA